MTPSKLSERLREVRAACDQMQQVIDHMELVNLEAQRLRSSDSKLFLEWVREVPDEPIRIVLLCCTSNLVYAHSRFGSHVEKEWVIGKESKDSGLFLFLTLDESLEYIRHFIWADKS
jgi:hypothetical protein